MREPLLSLQGLRINDPSGNTLVDGVSIELFDREFVGIVGESGSGKSLTALALLHAVPEGLTVEYETLHMFNQEVGKMSDQKRRTVIGKKVGYVAQNTVAFLHPFIKIKKQIGDGYRYHFKKSRRDSDKKATRILELVGIDDPERILNSYPFELSGGMKQRVQIASALMTDPEIIIADEPTTALDTIHQRQVMNLFAELNQNLGIPILFISHDLHIIKKYCQRLYVMHEGKIVESGPVEKVFAHPEHPYTKKLVASTLFLDEAHREREES